MLSAKTSCAGSLVRRGGHQRLATMVVPRAYSPAQKTAQQADTPALSLLDAAMSAVLGMFEDKRSPAHDASKMSEELQLPPELKAYLEQMEAQVAGSHGGGWVHSHIAERLASDSSSDDA